MAPQPEPPQLNFCFIILFVHSLFSMHLYLFDYSIANVSSCPPQPMPDLQMAAFPCDASAKKQAGNGCEIGLCVC